MTTEQLNFIKKISIQTIKDYPLYKILPSLTIAQAILESGWGKSELATKANAIFGIKCGTSWKGKKYNIKTSEQKENGEIYYILADFRAYDSIEESITDHNKFLQAERYKEIKNSKNYKIVCKEIQKAGYATALDYKDKLIKLIEQYKLYEYDIEILDTNKKEKEEIIKMNIIKKYLINNDSYKANKKLSPRGIILHSIGCPQENAEILINSWNKSNVRKSIHGFIQADGKIYQTIPFDVCAWHSGKNDGNNNYLGFEMMEPKTIKYTKGSQFIDNNPEYTKEYVLKTYSNSVKLFAYLCDLYNLDPLKENVILSHSGAFKLGLASNHGDVEHIWNKFGLTMDKFRQDINNELKNNDKKPELKPELKPEIKPEIKTKEFKVKINVNILNVRDSYNSKSKINTTIKKNEIYTITEINDKWGKLKSGAGWIYLDYTIKL